MDTNGGSKVHFQTFYLMQVSCYPKCKLQNTIGLMSLLRPLSELFALVFVTVVPFWLQCTPHNEINRGIHSVLQAFSLMKVDLQLDLNFVSQKKVRGKVDRSSSKVQLQEKGHKGRRNFCTCFLYGTYHFRLGWNIENWHELFSNDVCSSILKKRHY